MSVTESGMNTLRLAVLLCLCVRLSASDVGRTITPTQARELVLQTLQQQGFPTRASTFELDDENDKYFPHFYTFHAYSNSDTRLVSTGVFAVNKRTADVWDESVCVKINLTGIRALQTRLRKQTALTEKEYASLTDEGPCTKL